jgi:hypothetical protein
MLISIFLTVITFFWFAFNGCKREDEAVQEDFENFHLYICLLTFIVVFLIFILIKMQGVEYFYFCLLFAVPFF